MTSAHEHTAQVRFPILQGFYRSRPLGSRLKFLPVSRLPQSPCQR